MLMENSYRCGCHYLSKSGVCPYHKVPAKNQSGSNPFVSKRFKRKNKSLVVAKNLKSIKGKFDYIRITNVDKKISVEKLKPFIHKDTVLIVDCFDPKVKEKYAKLLPFAAMVTTLSIVTYADKKFTTHGYQLIFTKQDLPRLPVLAYKGSNALLESYWLDNFKIKSIFNPYATEDSIYIGAMKKKLKFVMQTDCYSLARYIIDKDYRAMQLPNLDSETKVNPI